MAHVIYMVSVLLCIQSSKTDHINRSTTTAYASSTDINRYISRYYLVNHGCVFGPYCSTTEEPNWCSWSLWTQWSKCKPECTPKARRKRKRKCLTDTCESGKCGFGRSIEYNDCSNETMPCCKGFPRWSPWNRWVNRCGSYCAVHEQTRYRGCYSCSMTRDCSDLPGSDKETKTCKNPCPPRCLKHSYWGPWSRWSKCKIQHPFPGKALRKRTRVCVQHECTDGSVCIGESEETAYCEHLDCLILTDWSEWSECKTNHCNEIAVRVRNRKCKKNPRCALFISRCWYNLKESEFCTNRCCKEGYPKWTEWTQWSNCSEACGLGSQTRNRACSGTSACLNNSRCEGEWKEERTCFTLCCKNMTIGPWASWSTCPTMGGGLTTRMRTCEAPDCEQGEAQCATMKTETRICPSVFRNDTSCLAQYVILPDND